MSKPAYLPSPGLVRAAGGRGGVEGVAHVAHGGADLPVAAAPAAAPEVVQVVRTVRRAEPGAIPCPMSDVPCPMRCRSAGSGEVRKRGSERSERSERSESTAPARRTTIANRTNQHAAAKKDQKEADKVPPPRTGSDPNPHHPPTLPPEASTGQIIAGSTGRSRASLSDRRNAQFFFSHPSCRLTVETR